MRYININLIDEQSAELQQWMRTAREKEVGLEACPDHQARHDFLKMNAIWRELKPYFIETYGDKCWYSDCDITGSFGDIDHFRPKEKSTDCNGTTILPDGYWWLAYNYKNYRLSCEKCNRKFEDGGKSDHFPLKEGANPASYPEQSEDDYLLIDPCCAEDVALVGYNDEGRAIPLSQDPWKIKRVKCSRWIYNLDVFNNARKKVQNQSKMALQLFEMAFESNQDLLPAIEGLIALTDDKSPYSSVARQYISLKIASKPYEETLRRIIEGGRNHEQ